MVSPRLLAEQQAADKAKSAIPDPLNAEGSFVFREPALSDIPQDLPPDRPPGPRSGLVNPPKSKPPERRPVEEEAQVTADTQPGGLTKFQQDQARDEQRREQGRERGYSDEDMRNLGIVPPAELAATELAQHQTGFVGTDYKPTPGAGPLPFGQLPGQTAADIAKSEADYNEAGRVEMVADRPIAAKPSTWEETGPIYRQGQGVTTPRTLPAPPRAQRGGFGTGQGTAPFMDQRSPEVIDRERQQARNAGAELARPDLPPGTFRQSGAGAAGSQAGAAGAGGSIQVDGKEASETIEAGLTAAATSAGQVLGDTLANSLNQVKITGEFIVGPARVIVSTDGVKAILDPELETKIATAVHKVINPADGTVRSELGVGLGSAANNPTLMS